MELISILGIDLGLILAISGLSGYIKHAIPDTERAKLHWAILTFLPVICGLALALLVDSITIKQGLIAGVLSSIGYKAEKGITENK